MKLSLAVVAALATGASATPIRLIEWTDSQGNTFTPESSDPGPARISKFNNGIAPWISDDIKEIVSKHKQPCHKMTKGTKPSRPSSFLPGPIGSLLSSLGLRNEPPSDHHKHVVHHMDHHDNGVFREMQIIHFDPDHSVHQQETGDGTVMDAWEQQVEKMVHDVEENVLPFLEGGMMKILPVMDDHGHNLLSESDVNRKQKEQYHKHHSHHHDSEADREMRIKQWDAMEGKNGIKAHHHKHHSHMHHRQPQTFACRLNKALRALKPTEALMFVFVCGAGVGSMLHFVYMMCLLARRKYQHYRFQKRRKASFEKRRAKLIKEGKPAKWASMCGCDREAAEKRWNEEQAAKAQGQAQAQVQGDVKAEPQLEGEVLPNYEEGEKARLVVDADKV